MSFTFNCPACDTFPFDTADELIEHINEVHTPSVPDPQPAPVVADQPTATVLIGTSAPVPQAAPASPGVPDVVPAQPVQRTATVVSASPAQKRYLRSLQAERPGASTVDPELVTKAEASAEIDRLLTIPRTVIGPRPTVAQQPQPDVPTGMHYRDGIIYDVKRSKAGRLYVMVLVLNSHGKGGRWEYRQSEPLTLLSTDTVLVRDTKAA